MKLVVDLHIHSKYARATSPRCDLETLSRFASMKGVNVLGTGDFTHPLWLKELEEKLEPADHGLYKLKSEINSQTRFLLSVEVSIIYSKGGKVRKVHHVICVPSLKEAKAIQEALAKVGRVDADGRPVFGMNSEALAELVFGVSEKAMLIPAHCWTPWFAIFGSKSGFNSIEECFEKWTPKIFAIETGLSCYDSETEVLTEKGWKSFSIVTDEDKICTINPLTEVIEYQKPQKIYGYAYRGKMYKLKTKRVDLLITPNHNLLYAPADFRTRRPYRLKEARDLFGKSKILRKDGIWKGKAPSHFVLPEVKVPHGSRFYSGYRTKEAKRLPIKPWLKFFGFWMAEGWVTKGGDGDYSICVANYKEPMRDEIVQILKELDYKPYKDEKIVRVRDYQIFSYLRQFGKAADKFIPLETKALSKELLEIFFQYYLKGDGHIYGRNGKGLSATTISTRLRDDLQEVALKIGISAYYKLHYKKGTPFASPSQKKEYRQSADSWNIYFIRRNRHAIIPSQIKKYKRQEEWVDYDGKIYCVSVPNRTVYVRRNGIPLWCGNSDPVMNWMVPSLDTIAIISNSDCHSPEKIMREANVFDCELSYDGIYDAIKTRDPKKFLYTIEFFPEEGKYHYDGHRACNVSMPPERTKELRGVCPRCGRPLTVGVLSRVGELAKRPYGKKPPRAIPFKNFIPLDEIIAQVKGTLPKSKIVERQYQALVHVFGNELRIIEDISHAELARAAGDDVAKAVIDVREGRVKLTPGYDGEYGKIELLGTPQIQRQKTLF